MNYPLSQKYNIPLYTDRIMGPNPIKLEEELLRSHSTPAGAAVLDLGSGQGVTSVFLAKEYGFRVTAADLWSDPDENRRFFSQAGLTGDQIVPIKADATGLPFAPETFDAVVSTDSYNYFGRDPLYLDEKLLPCVKRGGYLYIAIPGMKKDCHSHLPRELLLSWTPEQLDYLHDVAYWKNIVGTQRSSPYGRWRATRRSGPTGWNRTMNTPWEIGKPWKPGAEGTLTLSPSSCAKSDRFGGF